MIKFYYKNASILFVGINPHPGTYERGVPFSNNKMFWYLLARAGLINETIEDLKDDIKLKKIYANKFNKKYKLGLVNIIDRPTRNISYLKSGEEKIGSLKVEQIIKKEKPNIVCFVGKITYQKYKNIKQSDFGWQDDIFDSKVFVMHAPLRGFAQIRIEELKIIKEYQKI